jgi:hypothetical protein
MPPRLKASANDHNGRLAQIDARLNGYEYVLMLNSAGKVSKGRGPAWSSDAPAPELRRR